MNSRFQQNGNRSNMSSDGEREAQVQRLALVLALTAITLCCGSATRAQTGGAFIRWMSRSASRFPVGIRAVGN